MKNLGWMVILIILSVVCIALSLFYFTDNDEASKPEIVLEATPTSSTLTWYTSIPQSHADRLAAVFKTETHIDVKIVRSSTFIIKERLMSEIERGKTEADVITLADIGTFIELKDRGSLMKYISPDYDNIQEAYKDAGYWAVFAGFGICMAYDETRTDAPPRHWTDLLDEKWKGRIGLEDINTAGSQYGQYYMLREKLGVGFWEKLLSVQQPKIFYRTEELANALLEGEIDIAGEFSIHTVYDYKMRRKTPINGIYPEEGIPFIVTPAAILEHTAHAQEAKRFLDFLLSIKGQELMRRLNYKYSVLKGIAPLDGIPPLDSLNMLLPGSIREYAARRGDYTQEFNAFFQRRE